MKEIFLSSTYLDLAEYRKIVMDTLPMINNTFLGMENFGQSNKKTLEECYSAIDRADLIISILGTRYGSCPRDSKKSYTQLEIEYAIKKKKTIHSYYLDTEKQKVLAKYVDDRENLEKIKKLQETLNELGWRPQGFTTPDELGRLIAINMKKTDDKYERPLKNQINKIRESAYDYIAEWYDDWYQNQYCADEPYNTICTILKRVYESKRGNLQGLKFLDCACGTGNTFIAFIKNQYDIFGTDGSKIMLEKAKSNCLSLNLSPAKLIMDPINWNDLDSYLIHFPEESFDVIVNTSNSFCHIPIANGIMTSALKNMYRLLRPGGILLIDTKRYINDGTIGQEVLYRELRKVSIKEDWIIRQERLEINDVEGLGEVKFHTRIVYDKDPKWPKTIRAIIIITVFGEALNPITRIIPYYPLPVNILEEEYKKAGFLTEIIPAYTADITINWKYDFVLGRKPR